MCNQLLSLRKSRAGLLASAALLGLAGYPSQAKAACNSSTPCFINLGTLGGSSSSSVGISADGSVVAGISNISGNTSSHAFRWTNDVMTDLGTLGGTFSYATAISADGSAVVGASFLVGNTPQRAFRWTNGVMTDLGTLGGTYSAASAISADGVFVAGTAALSGDASYHAFRWDNGVMTDLGTLGGALSEAVAISADGSIVAGNSRISNGPSQHAFRWTNGIMTDLGTLGGTNSFAVAISSDGSTVVGNSFISGDVTQRAFRWSNGVMTDLGALGGTFSDATAVSADGLVVGGRATLSGDTVAHAFRWANGVMTDLGTLSGNGSGVTAMSANGAVVIGYADIVGGNLAQHPFRWTQATGMRDLNTLLMNAGVNMSGVELQTANAISSDGRFITGNALFANDQRAYLVRYEDGMNLVGITTSGAQQKSVSALADQRTGMSAQQHGLAAPLLGSDKPIAAGGEVGIFASGGSASAGGSARYTSASGFSILGGAAWAREDYANTELKNSWIAAGALQYMHNGWGFAVRPLVEVGGWIAPNASLSFNRTYSNGAGLAFGAGNTTGDLSYVYGRAGAVIGASATQIMLSGEYGRQQLKTAAYYEKLANNPFNAVVSDGIDAMDVVKMRLQGSRDFGRFDATIWGAHATGFNRTASYTTNIVGIGALTPYDLNDASWAEYGVRLGYKISNTITADLFANGVSGDANVGTRVHGGAGLRGRF